MIYQNYAFCLCKWTECAEFNVPLNTQFGDEHPIRAYTTDRQLSSVYVDGQKYYYT